MAISGRRLLERLLLCSAVLLLAVFGVARLEQFYAPRAELAKFEARVHETHGDTPATDGSAAATPQIEKLTESSSDFSLWSATRIKRYLASLSAPVEPLAILKIPKIGLTVPVLEGTSAFTLNRGVGRIPGTARPGQNGNVGIAGHRDSFFRGLKDVRQGDSIELVTDFGIEAYVIRRIRITTPHDMSALQPTSSRALTLVTCYPFYYVGSAPQRFIVEASSRN
jgi:sortase A